MFAHKSFTFPWEILRFLFCKNVCIPPRYFPFAYKEHKNFASKRKISRGNANIFQSNEKFIGERKTFAREPIYGASCVIGHPRPFKAIPLAKCAAKCCNLFIRIFTVYLTAPMKRLIIKVEAHLVIDLCLQDIWTWKDISVDLFDSSEAPTTNLWLLDTPGFCLTSSRNEQFIPISIINR